MTIFFAHMVPVPIECQMQGELTRRILQDQSSPSIEKCKIYLSHSRNNRQSKAVKNGMNLRISLLFINQAASSNCNKLSKDVGDSQPMAECGRTLL